MAPNSSFYYSFLFLPAVRRRALTAVFDFCRAVDDSVDLEPDPAKARAALAAWRGELDVIFSSDAPSTVEGRALQPFVSTCQLTRANFEALIDGVEMDLTPRRYETFADLEAYCHRVASAVGLMSIEVFGLRESDASDYARDLGVALQLTNILRDVAVDFRRGRMYLPTDDLARFGCTQQDIRHEIDKNHPGVENPKVRAVLEHHAGRARGFFTRAERALPPAHRRALIPAEIMRAIYWDLLRRIEAAACDVFSGVIRVPRPVQARLAMATWWKTRRHRRAV